MHNSLLDLLSDENLFSEIKKIDIEKLRFEYENASPYPHIVLDNLFPQDILDCVISEFPEKRKFGKVFDNSKEVKLATNNESQIPLFTRHFLYSLNSETFLKFVSSIVNIPNLVGDPYFEGGGLHQILPGGKLAIHADFNIHSKLRLDRRLNILIYLNKDWKDEYGGNFEMWDQEMKGCEKKVAPLFNRTVIFSTTSTTYHGHPDPLTAPEGMSRKSIALYYYTNGRPEGENNGHHSTVFRNRPGEKFALTVGQKLKKLLPKKLRRYF